MVQWYVQLCYVCICCAQCDINYSVQLHQYQFQWLYSVVATPIPVNMIFIFRSIALLSQSSDISYCHDQQRHQHACRWLAHSYYQFYLSMIPKMVTQKQFWYVHNGILLLRGPLLCFWTALWQHGSRCRITWLVSLYHITRRIIWNHTEYLRCGIQGFSLEKGTIIHI